MTRRETLETRVEKLASRFERIGESQAKYEIIEALLQVEREVLGRVKKAVVQKRAAIHPEHTQEFKSGAGNVLYDLEQWLETQQQEQT